MVFFSLERVELSLFDANITPYEHTSLYPSYLCLYSLALTVAASSERKKAVCFVEIQEGLKLAVHLLFVLQ